MFLALVLASWEALLPHGHADAPLVARLQESATIFALLSATAGLFGVVIGGFGLLYAGRKRRWLHMRLMTERIRQFHFQTFVLRLPDIRESLKGPDARGSYIAKRKIWLDNFIARFEGKLDSEFVRITDDESESAIWLHDVPVEAREGRDVKELEPLFQSYRELRIMHQLGYADHKLSDDHRILSESPRRQAAVLATSGLICIALLCALHAGVVIAVLFAPEIWVRVSVWVAMLAILLALTALALRAVEQGLQPERELERYQQYRSALRSILDRFDQAGSQAEKLKVMLDMERLSVDEMRDFLITNDRSRFVM